MTAQSDKKVAARHGIAAGIAALATPLDVLDPLPGNPRRGDVAAVARSFERFGQRKPIVARRTGDRGVVIAGNHQLAAARQLKWTHVAVLWTDDDDETAAAFALADNRTADLGSYDDAALLELLAQVHDEDLLAATGYSDDDIAALGVSVTPLGGPVSGDPDDVPDSAPSISVAGDVWMLGPHRVMCGDSTSPTDLERLMDGEHADMVWTDPPYGIAYVGGTMDALTIQNDDLRAEPLRQLLRDSLGNAADACRPGAAWFVAGPDRSGVFGVFLGVLEELGIYRQLTVWVKDQFVMGRSDYHYRHEAIFYGWKPGAAHHPPPDRTQDTIWEFPRPKRSAEHPTMKPVALIERAIANHTDSAEVVLDPFGGSGSTLIAAHQQGRVARLMELDPRYVDVICKRWQLATGSMPVAESTKREHDFVGSS